LVLLEFLQTTWLSEALLLFDILLSEWLNFINIHMGSFVGRTGDCITNQVVFVSFETKHSILDCHLTVLGIHARLQGPWFLDPFLKLAL
jgi:hypothetical protein